MATFNSSRGSRESGNVRTFVAFQTDVSIPLQAVRRLAGKTSGSGWNRLTGAKIFAGGALTGALSVQFQSSFTKRMANDSGIRNCCSLRLGSTADFTLAVLPLGICSGVAVSLCRDVQRVVGWCRSGIPSYHPFGARFLLQLPAPS